MRLINDAHLMGNQNENSNRAYIFLRGNLGYILPHICRYTSNYRRNRVNKIFENIALFFAAITAAMAILFVFLLQCVLAVLPVAIGAYIILWFLGKV